MNVIGMLNIDAFPDYKDGYRIEKNFAIVDYGFLANAYEDICTNLAGEYQAKAFLEYVEKNKHGIFIGDGYKIQF